MNNERVVGFIPGADGPKPHARGAGKRRTFHRSRDARAFAGWRRRWRRVAGVARGLAAETAARRASKYRQSRAAWPSAPLE